MPLNLPSPEPCSLTLKTLTVVPQKALTIKLSCVWDASQKEVAKLMGFSLIKSLRELTVKLSPTERLSNLVTKPTLRYRKENIVLTLPPNTGVITDHLELFNVLGLNEDAEAEDDPESEPSPSKRKRVKKDGDFYKIANLGASVKEIRGKPPTQNLDLAEWPTFIRFGYFCHGSEMAIVNTPSFPPGIAPYNLYVILAEAIKKAEGKCNLDRVLYIDHAGNTADRSRDNAVATIKWIPYSDYSSPKTATLTFEGTALSLLTLQPPKPTIFPQTSKVKVLFSEDMYKLRESPVEDYLDRFRPVTLEAHGISLGKDVSNPAFAHIDCQGRMHFLNRIIANRGKEHFRLKILDYAGNHVRLDDTLVTANFAMDLLKDDDDL